MIVLGKSTDLVKCFKYHLSEGIAAARKSRIVYNICAQMTSTLLSGHFMPVESTVTLKAKVKSRVHRLRVSAAISEPPVSQKELRKPRSENIGADKGFFVDHTCIGTLSHKQLLRDLPCPCKFASGNMA